MTEDESADILNRSLKGTNVGIDENIVTPNVKTAKGSI
jgi:hypothetical protein